MFATTTAATKVPIAHNASPMALPPVDPNRKDVQVISGSDSLERAARCEAGNGSLTNDYLQRSKRVDAVNTLSRVFALFA